MLLWLLKGNGRNLVFENKGLIGSISARSLRNKELLESRRCGAGRMPLTAEFAEKTGGVRRGTPWVGFGTGKPP
jgi:hypothetical protein